jgi:thiamine-phosphate pyrophosphorylase
MALGKQPDPEPNMNARPPCQLYLITPPKFDPLAFAPLLEAALAAGPVAAVQLRLKGASPEAILHTGTLLRPLAQGAGVAFIVNDDPELADRLNADGVHIGQTDAPYARARALMGADRTVGVTCHDSRHFAMEAAEAGADYVAFGAFHPTATKNAPTRAEPEILTWWQALMETPCVAIGGITAETAGPLASAGADFVAVSAGVWAHPDGPAAGVKALNAAIKGAF